MQALGDRARGIALGAFVVTFFSIGLLAQDDPPTRVARLNYINGNVSMEPAGVNDWAPAVTNRPFTIGDYLYTDTGAEAELHMDVAVIRMGSQTDFGFLNLDDRTTQIKLTEGDLYVRIRNFTSDQVFEVDTPNGAVTLVQNGTYRFRVDPSGQWSFIVVRNGQAQVTGGGQSFLLDPNQSVNISGTDQMSYDVETAPAADDFDKWATQRDAHESRLRAAQYVAPTVIGYEDLDDNGSWQEASEYGPVWYPREADAGWAPYQSGHWAWIDPWGWTWVDNASWGFAPFHYGRWVYVSGRWGWCPGPRVGGFRPYYAPALVAWFGGSHWGVSIGIGGGGPALGWVALGFGEVYTPPYVCSRNYFRDVNVYNTRVTNVTVINNVYNTVYVNHAVYNQQFVNARAPHAVMAMSQSAFASGQPVRTMARPVAAAQIASIASARVAAPPVAPTRQALMPSADGRTAPHPPAQLLQRQVVARATPPPAPASFAAKQSFLQQHAASGEPLNHAQLRQAVPATHVAAAVRVMSPAATRPVAVHAGARVGSPVVAGRPGTVPQPGHVTAAAQPAAHGAPPNRAAAEPAARTPQPEPARPAERSAAQPAARAGQPAAARPAERAPVQPAAHGAPPNRPAAEPGARTPQPPPARSAERSAPARAAERPAEPAARTPQPPPARSAERSAPARPAERPAAQPAARTPQPAPARPAERSAPARAAERPTAQPGARTPQAAPAHPAERPAARPAERTPPPAPKPAAKPAPSPEHKAPPPPAHPEKNTKSTKDTKP